MKVEAEFVSDLFPAESIEDAMINPGIFGKRLAEFLVAGLRREGLTMSDPGPEDWGWYLEVNGLAVPFMIGAANVDGEANQFRVFIDPSTPIIKKLFKKIDISDDLARVSAALERVLIAELGIRELQWTEA